MSFEQMVTQQLGDLQEAMKEMARSTAEVAKAVVRFEERHRTNDLAIADLQREIVEAKKQIHTLQIDEARNSPFIGLIQKAVYAGVGIIVAAIFTMMLSK